MSKLLKEIALKCKQLEEDYTSLDAYNLKQGKDDVAMALRGAKVQFRQLKEMAEFGVKK